MSQLIQTRIQFQHHQSPIEKEDTFSLSDGDTDSEGEIDRYWNNTEIHSSDHAS